jgi:hypothetical protein
MANKTLCAVGDSFIFGAELVQTHYPDAFAHLSKDEMTTLEFDIPKDQTLFKKYFELLDTMRFTSLMAKELDYDYINFAQSGASQEGIKLQAYLLLESLKKKSINPKDTVWVVGVTVPSRVMQLLENNDTWINTLSQRNNDLEFVLSRFTSRSIFPGNIEHSHNDFSKSFAREFITHFNVTNFLTSWAMSLVDTANLLRAHKIDRMIFINLIPTLPHIMRKTELPETTLNTVRNIINGGDILPVMVPQNFEDLGDVIGITKVRCPGGHYDKDGNASIASHLLQEFFK